MPARAPKAAALAAGVVAIGALVTACGASAPPRSAAEIAAEAPFLGTSMPRLAPTTAPTKAATTSTPRTSTTPTTPATSGPVTMVVVGDAYTSGTAFGGLGARNWSALVAAHFGWTDVPLAAPGAGYLERGTGPETYVQRVAEVVAHRPQVVLIWGARNDVGKSSTALQAAATAMFTALKQQLPTAQIVAMGPSWTSSTPPATYTDADEAEKRAATAAGVLYLDDLAQNWLDGPGLVNADGIHPTDAGMVTIATACEADLVTLGVPKKAAAQESRQ